MPVTFSDSKLTLDKGLTHVHFSAVQDNKRIICAISREALIKQFGGKTDSLLDCFRANHHAIESKAAHLIEQGSFEPDGSILIRWDS